MELYASFVSTIREPCIFCQKTIFYVSEHRVQWNPLFAGHILEPFVSTNDCPHTDWYGMFDWVIIRRLWTTIFLPKAMVNLSHLLIHQQALNLILQWDQHWKHDSFSLFSFFFVPGHILFGKARSSWRDIQDEAAKPNGTKKEKSAETSKFTTFSPQFNTIFRTPTPGYNKHVLLSPKTEGTMMTESSCWLQSSLCCGCVTFSLTTNPKMFSPFCSWLQVA
jgi:hypothetical protein